MAQLDKPTLFQQIDLKLPILPTTKVKSMDVNAILKDIADSSLNKISEATQLAGNVGTFADFEVIMDAGLNTVNQNERITIIGNLFNHQA